MFAELPLFGEYMEKFMEAIISEVRLKKDVEERKKKFKEELLKLCREYRVEEECKKIVDEVEDAIEDVHNYQVGELLKKGCRICLLKQDVSRRIVKKEDNEKFNEMVEDMMGLVGKYANQSCYILSLVRSSLEEEEEEMEREREDGEEEEFVEEMAEEGAPGEMYV